jgi:predicted house-cleaning noncanonical NTP pyrophosphatase (MazG superfamily)
MKKRYYRKLVRDRIPEIIAAEGGNYETKVLPKTAFKKALKQKLLEESKEVMSAKPATLVTELADVLEILKSLAAAYAIPWRDIQAEQSKRRRQRGGFAKKLWLVWSSKK